MLLHLDWLFDQCGAAESQGRWENTCCTSLRGGLAVLSLHATYAWGNQAKHPDSGHLCLGSHSSSSFTLVQTLQSQSSILGGLHLSQNGVVQSALVKLKGLSQSQHSRENLQHI